MSTHRSKTRRHPSGPTSSTSSADLQGAPQTTVTLLGTVAAPNSRRRPGPSGNVSPNIGKELTMSSPTTSRQPAIARVWRGRVRRERADEYEAYNHEAGI